MNWHRRKQIAVHELLLRKWLEMHVVPGCAVCAANSVRFGSWTATESWLTVYIGAGRICKDTVYNWTQKQTGRRIAFTVSSLACFGEDRW